MKLLQRGVYLDGFGMNWAVMLLLACLVNGSHPVLVYSQGVTPESARVKAMVQKGIKFLNGYEHKAKTQSNTVDDHLGTVGGRALRALAIAKYHEVYKIPGGKSNRHVATALQDCRAIAGNPKKLPDAEGKMNLSAADIGGQMLVVSQFTLYGDVNRGRRPSFVGAAAPEAASPLFDEFAGLCREYGPVAEGKFGAMMEVELVNDGPVTLILER